MFAPAKINLALHVTGRRADGYHDLDSLVVFADVGDDVSLGAGPGLTVRGPYAGHVPLGADNLVLRAAALAGVADPALHLVKRLPPASGMGGGSSDAAAALKVLGAHPSVPDLMRLGADLPVCMIAPHPARMRSLGERVEVVANLPGLWMVLVNPGTPLPTPAVFRALLQPANPPLPDPLPRFVDAGALTEWLALQRNDLEGAAGGLAPGVGAALAALSGQPGCALARMTGSGATCFGLFPTRALRDAAARALARPGWFVVACATAHAEPA